MSKNFYGAIGLTGGVDGDLDYIDGAGLVDGDGCFVVTSSYVYVYVLDASSGAGESSPNIISPDTNPGTKRWLLKSMSDQDVSVASLPVFAGGQFTGVVQGITPVAGADLVTKEYADQLVGAFKTFFISDSVSGVGALEYAYPQETGEGQSSVVSSAFGAGDDQLINGWITEALEPGTTTIHAGLVTFHFHAKKGASNHRTTRLHFVLSWVDADGTTNKTTIVTSEESAELTDTEAIYDIHASVSADVEIASTARLILDVYANVDGGAVDSVTTLYMEGTEDSYFETKVTSGIWQNHSDRLDDLATTNATGAQLTELTNASETTLHSHAGSSNDRVGVDSGATPGYLGVANSDGVLRTGDGLAYTDGGDFVTLKVSGAYVDRGNASVSDFDESDSPTIGTFTDLDLGPGGLNIVPAGAKAVVLAVTVTDSDPGRQLYIRKNGSSSVYPGNVFAIRTQVSNAPIHQIGTVGCDANGVIEYFVTSSDIDTFDITVLGWFL